METERKTQVVLAVLTMGFAALAINFVRVPARAGVEKRAPLILPGSLAIVPGTIRVSAAQLVASGGDASGLQCYACHDAKKPPEIRYDANHRVVLPKEHLDLIYGMRNCSECHTPDEGVKIEYNADGVVIIPDAHRNLAHMAHGRYLRNEDCFNCHVSTQLDHLHTPEGLVVGLDQATQLCAGCHGTQYRDWESGAHGRRNGYWKSSAGPTVRQECTSCHDPHAPAFTPLIPMPAPHSLHDPRRNPS